MPLWGGVEAPFGELIPNLSHLSTLHTNFSDAKNLGGFTQLSATGWTMAGTLSISCGFPLRLPIGGNDFTFTKNFAKNATCLGDILHSYNYKQVAIMGQDSSFAGTRNFFYTHHIEVRDYPYYKANNLLPKDYHIGWGMEDAKVFSFVREFLSKYDDKEPFALYISTLDTHAPDGYAKATCQIHNDKYKNTISCFDKEISSFIEWIKGQRFYNNTTIVILGDHLSMKQDFFPSSAKRKVFNLFINPIWGNLPTSITKNRAFSHFDMFPTILSSLGFDISRAALGVNLVSKEQTLLEKLGESEFNKNLNLDSKLYEKLWN